MTNFPTKGEDKKISLRNSNWKQFDRAFAERLKQNHPDVWKAGGNIRGNEAFGLWGRALEGDDAKAVTDWIREREAWASRHRYDGKQFPEDKPTKSNIAGVVASIKWGVILDIGEKTMKNAVNEVIANKRDENRASVGGVDGFTEAVKKGIENKIDNYNDELDSRDKIHRATYSMGAKVFKRGVGAYKTNPDSVRPSVSSPEQWAYARLSSFLYALKNEKFRSGKHDTDLFPSGHPLKTNEPMKDEDKRKRVGTIDGEPVFDNKEDALKHAEEKGCKGFHTHDMEGKTVFMACEKHEDATDEDEGAGYNRKADKGTPERRFQTTASIELREADADTGERRVEGYASVFNRETNIGPFNEVVSPSAFEGRLNDPVVALFNHNQLQPLAKVGAGLELSVDDYGLRYSFPIPDTTAGRDLVELMERGIVRDASFAFMLGPDGDTWEKRDGENDLRTINRVARLVDVSVVTIGAYSDASSVLRSYDAFSAPQKDVCGECGCSPNECKENPQDSPETAPSDKIQTHGAKIRSAVLKHRIKQIRKKS